MESLEQLDDEELALLAGSKNKPKKSFSDVGTMSEDELEVLSGSKKQITDFVPKTFSESAIETLVDAGNFIDQYGGGASIRKGISELQEGKSIPEAVVAGAKQYGEPGAPSGKEIAAKAGLSQESLGEIGGMELPSPAGIAGFAGEVVLDPTNFIPVSGIARGAGRVLAKAGEELVSGAAKGAAGLAKVASKGAAKGAEVVAKTLGNASPEASKALGGLGATILKDLPDATRESIEAFAKEINVPIRKEFSKQFEIIAREGGDPSLLSNAHKFGPNSPQDVYQKTFMQQVHGTSVREAHNEGLKQVDELFNNKLEKLAGAPTPQTSADAGEAIQAALVDESKKFFDSIDFSYNSLADQAPGFQLTDKAVKNSVKKLSALKNKVQDELIEFGGTKEAEALGKSVLDILNRAEGAVLNGNYQDVLRQLRGIGKTWQKSGTLRAAVAPAKPYYLEAYDVLRQGVLESADETVGKEIGDTLRANNEAMTKFFRETEPLAGFKSPDVSPEKIWSGLIGSGDTKKVEAAVNALKDNPLGLGQIKSFFIKSIAGTNKDDIVNFPKLLSALKQDKNARIAKILFKPGELGEIKELAKIGADYGPGFINPPRTAEFLDTLSTAEGIKKMGQQRAVLKAIETQAGLPEIEKALASSVKGEVVPPPAFKPPQPLTPEEILLKKRAQESVELATKFGKKLGLRFIPTKIEMATKSGLRGLMLLDEDEKRKVSDEIGKSDASPLEKAKLINSIHKSGFLPLEKYEEGPKEQKLPPPPAPNPQKRPGISSAAEYLRKLRVV